MRKHKKRADLMAIRCFEALPDSEKDRYVCEIESLTPRQRLARSRPLNAREREQWRRFRKKAGRPKIGGGTTNVSVSLEKDLLRQADRFARRNGMSRSELIAKAVQSIIGSAA